MTLKQRQIKKLLPQRKSDSHKSQNGRVLIVGGSIDYFGAPLLTALGALRSGADLVHLAVPECNFEVSRCVSPNLNVRKYAGEYLSSRGRELILNMAKKADVLIIGPGLKDRPETLKAVKDIITSVNITTVLDADAIQVLEMVENMPLRQKLLITPHHHEFEKLIDKPFRISDPQAHKTRLIRTLAADLKMNILLKGPVDIVASDDGKLEENDTGNPGMTVGGTGDLLAGLVGGLIAQGMEPFEAACAGVFVLCSAGDRLFARMGYSYLATDLAEEIPAVMKTLL